MTQAAYLKEPCRCGGRVSVLAYRDSFTRKLIVDYGLCEECGQTTILPSEDYEKFVRENCHCPGGGHGRNN